MLDILFILANCSDADCNKNMTGGVAGNGTNIGTETKPGARCRKGYQNSTKSIPCEPNGICHGWKKGDVYFYELCQDGLTLTASSCQGCIKTSGQVRCCCQAVEGSLCNFSGAVGRFKMNYFGIHPGVVAFLLAAIGLYFV